MKKVLFFFLAVAVIVILFLANNQTEGFTTFSGVTFDSLNKGTPQQLNTKATVVNQPPNVSLAELGVGNIQPSPAPASDLPTAKYEQRSKETPNPYKNPTMEPAKYIRILALKEELQAFFGFQAGPLENRSDPAVQIPLTRARADMGELIDIQSVMERNPGIPSRLTNKNLEDIRSNLRYLQTTLRDLNASGAIEGFADVEAPTAPKVEKRATLKELQDFQIKVVVEIKRLEASGTTDPIIQARINTLNRIKDDVDQVIEQLKSGSLLPETVPIFASDIEKALPVLGSPTSPLPQLLQQANLPPAVASLFPGAMSPKDTEQMHQINNIVKGYMKNLFDGASWGVDVKFQYDNPNILKLKKEAAEAERLKPYNEIDTGLPGISPFVTKSQEGVAVENPTETPAVANRLNTKESYDTGLPGTSINRIFPDPKSGHLDWKARSFQIKEQIRRRGLNPLDFGALADNVNVSDNFSWRGYTQMMCMRLKSTSDPGLPQTVGCPPENWSGWKD